MTIATGFLNKMRRGDEETFTVALSHLNSTQYEQAIAYSRKDANMLAVDVEPNGTSNGAVHLRFANLQEAREFADYAINTIKITSEERLNADFARWSRGTFAAAR